jgi:hypothetical protein
VVYATWDGGGNEKNERTLVTGESNTLGEQLINQYNAERDGCDRAYHVDSNFSFTENTKTNEFTKLY